MIATGVIANLNWGKWWYKAFYERLLAELDKADYTSEEEKLLVRKYVEAAWKKAEKDTKSFIPPTLVTLV